MPAVSRPGLMLALSGMAGLGGGPRRSPVEIIATMGSYVTRTQAAEVSHPSQAGHRDWAGALLAVVASTQVRSA